MLHDALVAAAKEGTADALPLAVNNTVRQMISRYPLEFKDTPEGSARQLEHAARLYTDLKLAIDVEPGRLLAANRDQLDTMRRLADKDPDVAAQVAAGIVANSDSVSPRYLERMYEQDLVLARELSGDAAGLIAAVDQEFEDRMRGLYSLARPDVDPARLRRMALQELTERAERLGSLIEAAEAHQAGRPVLSQDAPPSAPAIEDARPDLGL